MNIKRIDGVYRCTHRYTYTKNMLIYCENPACQGPLTSAKLTVGSMIDIPAGYSPGSLFIDGDTQRIRVVS